MFLRNYQTCVFMQFQKNISKGLGSSHPKTKIIFQFVQVCFVFLGFSKMLRFPNFFYLKDNHPYYEEQKRNTCDLFQTILYFSSKIKKKEIQKLTKKAYFWPNMVIICKANVKYVYFLITSTFFNQNY